MRARYQPIALLSALVLMVMAGCQNLLGLDDLEKRYTDDDDDRPGTSVGGMGPGTSVGPGGGDVSGCGDGFTDLSFETCDDGNNVDGDGCSSSCIREPGWCCVSQPSSCVPGPIKIGGPNAPIPIPDGGLPDDQVCMSIPFPGYECGAVFDVDVLVSIDHPYVGDLVMMATSPQFTEITLVQRPSRGVGPDSSNLAPDHPILFDDEGSAPAQDMGLGLDDNQTICLEGPQICSYIPEQPLTLFNEPSPDGIWEFCVGDDSNGDIGTLQGVEFIIYTD